MTARVVSLVERRAQTRALSRVEHLQIIGVEHLEECCRRLRRWERASDIFTQARHAFRLLKQAEREGL